MAANSTMSPKGQDITPKQCVAWRPRLTCWLLYSPAATSPRPSQEHPSRDPLSLPVPRAGRAGDNMGSGWQAASAGCGDQQWGHPAQPHTRLFPQTTAPTSHDIPQGRTHKAQNSGLRLSIISLALAWSWQEWFSGFP